MKATSERTAQGESQAGIPVTRQRRGDEETIGGESGREEWNRQGVVGGGIVREQVLSRRGNQIRRAGDPSGGAAFLQKSFENNSRWHAPIVS